MISTNGCVPPFLSSSSFILPVALDSKLPLRVVHQCFRRRDPSPSGVPLSIRRSHCTALPFLGLRRNVQVLIGELTTGKNTELLIFSIQGDFIPVQEQNAKNDRWFQGHVHTIRKAEVGLRFHTSFDHFNEGELFHVRFKPSPNTTPAPGARHSLRGRSDPVPRNGSFASGTYQVKRGSQFRVVQSPDCKKMNPKFKPCFQSWVFLLDLWHSFLLERVYQFVIQVWFFNSYCFTAAQELERYSPSSKPYNKSYTGSRMPKFSPVRLATMLQTSSPPV